MVFSSLLFLFRFLPLFLALYFLAPRKLRNGVLFIGSLIFYGWGEPVYISLLLFSTLVDFFHGKLVGSLLSRGNRKAARMTVASSAFINLSLLVIFKYTDFFIRSINSLTGSGIPLLGLALPIGISFYTFQTMSYTIDVYRGEAPVQNNIISFGAYVSMFPQLIAGPIVRYRDIAAELNARTESAERFSLGVRRFVVGLGKKVLLANQAGALWTEITAIPPSGRSVLMVWMGILAFAFQIYFDFSGYSDMAIGLGKMFGFDFLENFNYPYISTSITDFWRRWHMSLSSWFRDYVYIPLGGNRKGKARQCLNIMIVWFLTGFWHGANWNFMLWGVYFGVILLCEKLFLGKALKKIPAFFQHLYALLFIVIGWGIFSYEDFGKLTQNFKNMFGAGGLPFINHQTVFWLAQYAVTLVILVIASTQLPKKLCLKLQIKCPEICGCILQPLWALILLAVSTAYLAGNSFNPFLYFRF